MKILIIRFRQIGDSVLTLALCNSLKKSFKDSEIHLVLNKSIAPLFENHPSIDKIISFDKSETSSFPYLRKVWNTVHETKYDVIIDMRSTLKTSFFSLFSLHSKYRIGRKKWYTKFIHKYRLDMKKDSHKLDMVGLNLKLISPLENEYLIEYDRNFRLEITEQEKQSIKDYLQKSGVDLDRPILLAAVASKLSHKMWNIDRMGAVLQRVMDSYDVQIIFNYVPGHEEEIARDLYKSLNKNSKIFIDIQTKSLRELAALSSFCSFFFGNESGNRHIAHAMGVPSFSIVSPGIDKHTWLPLNNIEAKGLSIIDIENTHKDKMSHQELYNLITVDLVWAELKPMLDRYLK